MTIGDGEGDENEMGNWNGKQKTNGEVNGEGKRMTIGDWEGDLKEIGNWNGKQKTIG